ncbi:MAG: hypothetical protein AB7G75_29855 [Candidatus Binatia bacterium]
MKPSGTLPHTQRKRRVVGKKKQASITHLEQRAKYGKFLDSKEQNSLTFPLSRGLDDPSLTASFLATDIATHPALARQSIDREYRAAQDEAWDGIKNDDLTLLLTHLETLGPELLKDPRLWGFFVDTWRDAKNSEPTASNRLDKILKALSPGGGRTRKPGRKDNVTRQQEFRDNVRRGVQIALQEIEERIRRYEAEMKRKKLSIRTPRDVRTRFTSAVVAEMQAETLAPFLRSLKPPVTVAHQQAAAEKLLAALKKQEKSTA